MRHEAPCIPASNGGGGHVVSGAIMEHGWAGMRTMMHVLAGSNVSCLASFVVGPDVVVQKCNTGMTHNVQIFAC